MKKKYTLSGIGIAAGALLIMMTMHVSAHQMTVEKAKEIALENAGIKEEDLTFVKTKSDYEDGRQI